jgi:3-oxoacyl-[acyl-carrier protein] reductase
MRLDGRTTIITGAASGIGKASAQLFASEGANVLAVDRPGTPLAEIHAEHSGISVLEQDVTDDDAPGNIVDTAIERYGRLDILFNNAGISRRAIVGEQTEEDWNLTLSVI